MSHVERLRTHPGERLADPVTRIDLDDAFANLPAESRDEPDRAQHEKALFRQGPVTTAILALNPGATLPEHTVEGSAILHCLSGRIHVRAAGKEHILTAHQLLCLAPEVPHDVRADEPSRLLLHVVLDKPAG